MRQIESQGIRALLVEAQEQERKAVSRDLHDSVGSCLSAVKLGLARKLQAMREGGFSTNAPSIEDLMARVQEAIEETRRIQKNLRPPLLDDLGLLTALGALSRDLTEVLGTLRITPVLPIGEDEIPESLKIVFYRICQEALNNVAKHSGAEWARLSLSRDDHRIVLKIEDNGGGFETSRPRRERGDFGGMGLSSMKERAELSGGYLSIVSSEGRGTIIEASWPSQGEPPMTDHIAVMNVRK